MTISNVSEASAQHQGPDRAGRLEQFVQRLKNDDSAEAKGVKDSFQKLVDDQKSGTADAATLQADRKALHEAMHTYRQAHEGTGAPQAQGTERPHHRHHKAEGAAPASQPAWYQQNGTAQSAQQAGATGATVNLQA